MQSKKDYFLEPIKTLREFAEQLKMCEDKKQIKDGFKLEALCDKVESIREDNLL